MKQVFEPWSIGTLTLKNRIIRSATHEGMANPDGSPTEHLLKNYRKLAAGGVGAIITGYVSVMQNGKTFRNMRMFDSDLYIDIYRSINEQLRQYDTPVILQIAHGGYGANAKVSGQAVIGPSFRKKNEHGDVCKEASDADIESIIDAFVCATVRAKAAGFAGIQFHAAHGYLLSEFISEKLNKRRDKWGGPIENRLRIVTEILNRARQETGTFPLLVKISGHDQTGRDITETDTIAMARLLQNSSCDALEVSCGYGDFMNTIRVARIPIDAILGLMPAYRDKPAYQKLLFRLLAPFLLKTHKPILNYNLRTAELIKKQVSIPVFVVGGIRHLKDIRAIISEKDLDGVSLSRPFIIEPSLVEKFQKGQESSKCINCGYCLIGAVDNPLKCYYGKVPKSCSNR
ncbi:MAG: NADH:flavin oxidoreductase [Nitrospirae bacterium]|nr:NADH:flavin oxidoreductase [Nitrospirota bacterium]